MAPQKPKKPTMLQRQRQLRAQQQQIKRASSKQLPASGDSSGNSRQARGQRANTSRAQAANNQRIINRGIEGFIRRGNAQDKLDKAAQGTRGSGTRTAGAGGGLANQQKPIGPRRQLTSSTKGGNRIGNSSQPWGEQPVRQVKVKDLGSNNKIAAGPQSSQPSLSGTKTPAKLPGGTGGADTVRGSGVRTGQPGPTRAALPPGGRGGALATRTRGGGLGAALTGISLGRELGNAIGGAYGRAIRQEQAVRASSDGGRYVPGNQQRVTPPEAPKPAAKPKPPTRSSGGNPPAPGSIRRQSSGGGGSSAPSRPSSPQTSSGTAGKGQSWADFNPNRGTSKTNNPLIKKDEWMMSRMKSREDAANKKFDTNSDVYTPNTKVDGSNLDTKKIDQKKVDEYKRRKNRYYD